MEHPSAGPACCCRGLGRRRQARFLEGFDVDLPVAGATIELQELRADADHVLAFERSLADAPTSCELTLIEVSDIHLALLRTSWRGSMKAPFDAGAKV